MVSRGGRVAKPDGPGDGADGNGSPWARNPGGAGVFNGESFCGEEDTEEQRPADGGSLTDPPPGVATAAGTAPPPGPPGVLGARSSIGEPR